MIKWVLIVWITTSYHSSMPLEVKSYVNHDQCIEESVAWKEQNISKDGSFVAHAVCVPETRYNN